MGKQVVYKYHLNIIEPTVIELPIGAKVISTDMDGPHVAIWVYQGSGAEIPTESRTFDYYNTGEHLVGNKYSRRHIGSVKYVGPITDSVFFYHVFEEIK
jgi:hypothetical protein